MGNMQEKQDEMRQKLAQIEIIEDSNGIRVTANAAREILNVEVDAEILSDKEQLEDLLVVTMNKVMAKIAEVEAGESQKMISDMLPPGMSGLFGM